MSSSKEYQKLWLRIPDLEMFEVKGVPIPFSPSWQRICVNLSGGADSALLMALLCDMIKDAGYQTKVDAISLNRCWSNRPWQSFIAKEVFKKIKSMFPTIVENQHTCFLAPELEHSVIGFITADKETTSAVTAASFNDFHCFYNPDVAVVFHGRTKNSSQLDNHPFRMEFRDEPILHETVEKLKHSEAYVIRPFIEIEKDWIIEQYMKNEWESLLKTTRSCEANIEKFYKGWRFKADEPIPECGECYWCAERKWAIEKVVDKYNHGQDRL